MTEPGHETPSFSSATESRPTVRVAVDDGVAEVELDRPHRRNALSPRLREELLAALTRIADDEGVRAVVLTGTGSHFCAGADLKELDVQRLGAEMHAYNRLIPVLRALPQPVIARVQGSAVGAGCNLALACDLVVAGESARFAQVFPRLGLSVDLGGSWILPRLVGPHRARELALLGDEVGGRAAADMGLINRCVPDALLDDTVGALARQLAGYSPAAQARTKQLLEAALTGTLRDALDRETEAQIANATTTYFDTTLHAFRAAHQGAPS